MRMRTGEGINDLTQDSLMDQSNMQSTRDWAEWEPPALPEVYLASPQPSYDNWLLKSIKSKKVYSSSMETDRIATPPSAIHPTRETER